MKKSIIVAVAENGVIGKGNDLIWHMPADLRWFVRQTKGKWVIMGRKSWESINSQPLPGRKHIIVSRNADYTVPEGVYLTESLESGYELAKKHAVDELMILGGGQIYEQALSDCDEIILTEIKASFEGDTYFPKLDQKDWTEVFREEHEPDEKNPYPYAFTILKRNT
jgi:dihydrofolate reductase